MTVAISGGIYLPRPLPRQARKAVSSPNPAHERWLKHRKGREPGLEVTCAGDVPGTSWVWVPRFAPVDIGDDVELQDRLRCEPAPPLPFTAELRPYQALAVTCWLDEGAGTLVAPTGAGKTVIACAIASKVHSRCLVLVHTKDLLAQWVDSFERFTGTTPGRLGGGAKQIDERVVIATYQTLARWKWWDRYRWASDFGLVVADECHKVAAKTFAEVLSSLPGRHRLGLTATPERHDGLNDWIEWVAGPIVHTIHRDEVAGSVLKPRIEQLHTGFTPQPDVDDWHKLVAELVHDEDRNKHIAYAVKTALQEGRSVLVVTKSVEHAHLLGGLIPGAEVVTGKTPKKARADVALRARSGELRCTVATTIWDEGIDVPRLDTLVLAFPDGNKTATLQRIGRVLRPHPAKAEALVFDIVDGGPFQGWARKRRGFYQEQGWLS